MDDDDEGIVDINVTPLVDVMLVLLIIFMVASAYIVKPSIEVDLPKAATGGETLDTTLSVIVTDSGKLFLNGEPTTREAIKSAAPVAVSPRLIWFITGKDTSRAPI